MNRSSLQLTDNYGQRFDVAGAVAQIGSGTGRTVVLDAPDVLDLHAEIRFENSDWMLWDLSEGRGLSVNGVPVQTSQPLIDGDVITIGGTVLRVALRRRETEDLSIFRSDGQTMPSAPEPPPSPTGPAMKHCSTCGRQIYQEAEICPHCGVRQMPMTTPFQGERSFLEAGVDKVDELVKPFAPTIAGGRSRTTAAVLAILLGSFGAHRFYLGQIGVGVLYLVFIWTWIPTLAGIIEGIQFLNMSDQEFAAKYG